MTDSERNALTATVDEYLEALGARDPGRLNLAPAVKFTENCASVPVGKALWATATSGGSYRIYFADSGGEQVGAYAVVEEMGIPAILSLRLRVQGGAITEIEHVVGRDPLGAVSYPGMFDPAELTEADPIFEEMVEPARRSPREALIKAADCYYDAIEQGDGNVVPVIPECVRRENGVYSANNPERGGAAAYTVFDSIDMGYWKHLYIRDRRYPVVDEERCLAWSINFFETPGNVATLDLKGVGPTPVRPGALQPSALPVAELFKVIDGKIHRIETVLGPRLPLGTRSNWD